MTTYDALKWLSEEFLHTEYIDPFVVDHYFVDPNVTWKDIARMNYTEMGPDRYELINKHIESYINNKTTN